jgi:hypothetical protein
MAIRKATTKEPKKEISTAEFFRQRHFVRELENDIQRIALVRNTAKAMSDNTLTEVNREAMLWQFLQTYINIHK